MLFPLRRRTVWTVATLLPIINPISAAGMLIGITGNLTIAERNRQITMACIYMTAILLLFLLAGVLIMDLFGISIPGLRIAGGMIVAFLGFRMLCTGTTDRNRASSQRWCPMLRPEYG